MADIKEGMRAYFTSPSRLVDEGVIRYIGTQYVMVKSERTGMQYIRPEGIFTDRKKFMKVKANEDSRRRRLQARAH